MSAKKIAYNHSEIEKKWQKKWEDARLYEVTNAPSDKPKYYCLDMWPYPSGAGLHVGHVEGYTATDVVSRFKRMQGFEVLHPMGWDSFGLPAENYAIKTGTPPLETTERSIDTFRSQIKNLGLSYDWSREIGAHQPEYYRWTQWLFSQMYEHNLAYKAKSKVNWCPSCQTVLANEQVVEGKCERCDSEVIKKDLEQWFFKITEYAEQLLADLDGLDWPESTKMGQKNWIGKKKGVVISYEVEGLKRQVKCFTTRPETNFGATFVVVGPEHELASAIVSGELGVDAEIKKQVAAYVAAASKKNEIERVAEGREKTGVFTGLYAVNGLNGYKMPIYVADYVLGDVGTGAVVGVPGHDLRDFEFAVVFNIPVLMVIKQPQSDVYRSHLVGAENILNSDLDLLDIVYEVHENGNDRLLEIPRKSIDAYKDLVRTKLSNGYWNEIVGNYVWFCFKDENGIKEYVLADENKEEIASLCSKFCGDAIDKTQNIYAFIGANPWYTRLLVQEDTGVVINSEFLNGLTVSEACDRMMDYLEEKGYGEKVVNYKLRDWLVSRQRYWGAPIPIVYDPEGVAHLVPEEHLPWLLPTDVEFKPTGVSPLRDSKELHARVERLFGKGWTPEYDTLDTFVCSGWYFFRFADPYNPKVFSDSESMKKWLPVDVYVGGAEHTVLHLLYARFITKAYRDMGLLDFDEPFLKLRHPGIVLAEDRRKMSKRWGNVINPDDVVREYGADSVRLYELFMGPFKDMIPWSTQGLVGCRRFLDRVIQVYSQSILDGVSNDSVSRGLHQLIVKVGEDIEEYKFNTAISAMMAWINVVKAEGGVSVSDAKLFLLLLAPFAPHVAEELWARLGGGFSIHQQSWPTADHQMLSQENSLIVVQVNGKLRAEFTVPTDKASDKDYLQGLALEAEGVEKWIKDKPLRRVIVVPGKLVNIVI